MSFNLKIYTPEGILLNSMPAESVVVTTATGEIEVKAGHTHMVSTLDTGVLRALNAGSSTFYTVTSGLIKVLGNEITLLSTTSEKAEEIDFNRAKAAREAASQKLGDSSSILSEVERLKFQRKLDRANTRLRLSKK